MSIRVILCFLFVIGFSIYAWKNWFVSLCGAILLMAVLEHPDMPKSIGGIQGLNAWNLLMLNVLLAWRRGRSWEGLTWDMPRYIMVFVWTYAIVIVIGFARLILDVSALGKSEFFDDFSILWGTSEFLVNCFKWVLPGALLFDACRTRQRVIIGLVCTLAVYFLLALQVIKHMPLSSATASGAELSRRANKVLTRSVGYHRVNLSMMLSGASWAVLTTLTLVQTKRARLCILGAAAAIALGQALTGGRAGYVTWALLGTILCLLRWRALLPVIPATIVLVCSFLPSVRERMLQGIATDSGPRVARTEVYEVTSGRNIAWSYVIPMILDSPIVGYGRQAMIRTGIYRKIVDDYGGGETFPHPHNAYLECMLDNGLVGFVCIIPIYLIVLTISFRVLLDRRDPLFAAVGGTSCSLILALMIAAMGSQSFYPREGSVGMWAAIGLLLRVYMERAYANASGTDLFATAESTSPEQEPELQPA